MSGVLRAVALAFIVCVAKGFKPTAGYDCSPANCRPPACRCASDDPPLPINEMPQFVIISNDDAVNGQVASLMERIVRVRNNTNGCRIPATWFTLSAGTNCDVVRNRFTLGDEFAAHTRTHPVLNSKTPRATIVREVVGSRNFLLRKCRLPRGAVRGYRSTFLIDAPEVRQVLKSYGFTYDSSMGFSREGMSARPFPFTMDRGIPDRSCGSCGSAESYPRMWQLPVWNLKYGGRNYAMDPGMKTDWELSPEVPVGVFMKSVFDAAYNGNRAPVPMAVHVYWMAPARVGGAQNFIRYALGKPDVYFVTYRQLIDWMKKPVPKSRMAAWLKARCK